MILMLALITGIFIGWGIVVLFLLDEDGEE